MSIFEHDNTAAKAPRRALTMREAIGPGFAFSGASESTLCYASRLGWSPAGRTSRAS